MSISLAIDRSANLSAIVNIMVKAFLSYRKRAISFFGKHVEYNALVHVLGGIGLGIIIAGLTFPNQVNWALGLLALSILGHLYTLTVKTPRK